MVYLRGDRENGKSVKGRARGHVFLEKTTSTSHIMYGISDELLVCIVD